MDYFDDLDEDENDFDSTYVSVNKEDFKDSEESENKTTQELGVDASYICDSCGEEIIVPIDVTQGQQQEYVEDCPVCCNPNVITVSMDFDGRVFAHARAEQDR